MYQYQYKVSLGHILDNLVFHNQSFASWSVGLKVNIHKEISGLWNVLPSCESLLEFLWIRSHVTMLIIQVKTIIAYLSKVP